MARRQRPDGAEAAPRWQKAAPGGAEAAPDGEGGCYVGFAMRTLHISLILFEIHEHLTRFARPNSVKRQRVTVGLRSG